MTAAAFIAARDFLLRHRTHLAAAVQDRDLLERALAPAKLEWLERKASERNVELPPETAAAIRHMLLAVCESVGQGLNGLEDATQEAAQEAALLSSTVTHAVVLAMAAERAVERALRLNEARRTLKARSQPPITELANTLGFSSASHFTRHYKLMFDELPSETLKLHCYGPRI